MINSGHSCLITVKLFLSSKTKVYFNKLLNYDHFKYMERRTCHLEGVPLLKEGRNSIYLWKVVSQDNHQLTSPQDALLPISTCGCWGQQAAGFLSGILSIDSVESSYNGPGRTGWGQVQLNFLCWAFLELQCSVCWERGMTSIKVPECCMGEQSWTNTYNI